MMTLTDAGPMVALINRNDPNHSRCIDISTRLPKDPMLSTWPCYTEAMYLCYKAGGHPAQAALWALRTLGRLILRDLAPQEADRMIVLMEKYRDTPMDLADASLIVTAESLSLSRVFTVDSDFYVYRLADGSALEVIR
ncbi:MAG: type II toxin-antitoxin system VapC family toxin [Janthinobacterium lividum]